MKNHFDRELPQGNVTCIIRMDDNNVVSVRIATTIEAAREEYDNALSQGILVAIYRNIPMIVAGRIFEDKNDEHLANCSTRKEAVSWVQTQVSHMIIEDQSDL